MRISADIGYNTTNFIGHSMEGSFSSTVKEKIHELETAKYTVEYNNKTYLIGNDDGFTSTEQTRDKDIIFHICLYTAIAATMTSTIDNNVRVVTGLPAQFFAEQKGSLIKALENRRVFMKLNGESRSFTITKVVVFPQSAGLFLYDKSLVERDTLVVDIGGGTLDIAYMSNGQFKEGRTYPLGVNSTYDVLLQELSKYGVNYSNRMKAEQIIADKSIFVEGRDVNVEKDIDNILNLRAGEIVNAVKQAFPEQSKYSRFVFIGGGALLLKNYLNEYKVLDDAQMINVKTYDIIGKSKNV
ncbi:MULTISPECIES: ParM/StbA family protein [Clostridium]|jgi:plasmid segregation protein ParM|uniref:Actin-like ATPase involved in cell morphogenesis n=1 Tax=Clostridium saccharoperbutylacetonicum N1-4(HMT) TaxID=931276 RepID=M1MND6_9CLOT|nr:MULTISPECIES: ParM/StbA family protein [Clostridium]AGF59394.1 actin-like ATPase involved in cell morphogenesis [Clostridium saccharoperbutylacetonicum N1-4(HMT)]AQR98060.1 StbA protein [Clostridium saccharoperbutylacetonicum]NRT59815.1 plasmid segregation protein ParM [Clostridium saccharoperbutylacetonicum]NSB23127.1 plasmid segregation protein ParM [Clostridium saccharoperbutylacetonicum]NSB33953.1 plasmid segregation protein ParM [Clostridium saccharoperbutylacetonicum]